MLLAGQNTLPIPHTTSRRGYRAGFLITSWLSVSLLLAGCASRPYHGTDVMDAPFLQRAITLEEGQLRVTAAVPDAAETEVVTGLDLYAQGIQPVWLEVENTGSKPARINLWSIDRNYFSPIEVAYMNRGSFSAHGYADMERWFHDNGLKRNVPPGEQRSGLVFTHLSPGTKGFNLDVVSNRKSRSFTFFVPLPGFTADYMEVDFANLYAESDMRQLDPESLRTMLEEELPCCAQGPDGEPNGGPLNVVLVGTTLAVRRALLRGGWNETAAGAEETARARRHRFEGRPPDTIFHVDRKDGDERISLHIWLAPWRVDGEPAWVGQVYYTVFEKNLLNALLKDGTLRDSKFLSQFVRESVAADIDSAQGFLLQNFWYNQSLRKFGIVTGVGASTPDNPEETFDGVGYFTAGNRNVLFLSEEPVALGDALILYVREDTRPAAVQ
jgi:hypothetical protein